MDKKANPLQAIMSDVYLLKEELGPQCKAKDGVAESLECIESNISYINKIVADLQDYSRLTSPNLQIVKLYEFVVDVFEPLSIPDNLNCDIKIESS